MAYPFRFGRRRSSASFTLRAALALAVMVYAAVLAGRGARAQDVPDDFQTLETQDADARLLFLERMERAGQRTEKAVPTLIRLLIGEMKPDDHRVRRRAADELIAIGAPAVPPLVEQLAKSQDSYIVHVLGQIRPAPVKDMQVLLQNGAHDVRRRAANVLTEIGADAQEAAAQLSRIIRDAQIPVDVRTASLSALARMGSGAKGAAGHVALLLADDPNEEIRVFAANALRTMGINVNNELRALLRALEDPSPRVRETVCGTLESLGLNAWTAIPALSRLTLGDPEASVRRAAARAVAGIDVVTGAEALAAAIREPNRDARQEVLSRINQASHRSRFHWPPILMDAILEQVRDVDATVRETAIRNVANFPTSQRSVDALLAALGDENPTVRLAASEGLLAASIKTDRIVAALLAAARDRNESVRAAALKSLANTGRADPRTEAALAAAVRDDPSDTVRQAALEGLSQILRSVQSAGTADRPLGVIVDVLRNPNESETVRIAAAQALNSSSVSVAQAVPALIEAANARSGVSTRLVSTVLKALQTRARSDDRIPPVASGLIKHPDPEVAEAAIGVMQSVPESALRRELPNIAAALTASNPRVRDAAARVLAGKSAGFLEDFHTLSAALTDIARDPQPEVRRVAFRILASKPPSASNADLLAGALADPEPQLQDSLRNWLSAWLATPPPLSAEAAEALSRRLSDASPDVRLAAAIILAAQGTLGAASYEVLNAAIGRGTQEYAALAVKAAATAAANGVGEGLGLLIEGLKSEEPKLRTEAIAALRRHLPKYRQLYQITIPATLVFDALRNVDPQEAKRLRGELLQRGQHGRALEHQIKLLLQTGDPAARREMLEIYFQQQPNPASVAADLFTVLRDDQEDVRLIVLQRLRGLAIDETRMEEIAVQAMGDSSPKVRQQAAQVLGQLRWGSGRTLEALARGLADENPQVVKAAASAIGRLSPALNRVERPLLAAWAKRHDDAAAALYQTFVTIGAGADLLLNIGHDGLGAGNAELRSAIIGQLQHLPQLPDALLPDLVKALDDPSPDIRASAAAAVGRFGVRAQGARPSLERLLADPVPAVQTAAIGAVAAVTAESGTAVRFLLPFLEAKEGRLRMAALTALLPHAAAVPDAERRLVPLLQTFADPAWLPAARLALRAGIDPSMVGDAAVHALRQGTATVRNSAMAVLGEMGGVPSEAVDALRELLAHNSVDQRRRALATLELIAARAASAGDASLADRLESALAEVGRVPVPGGGQMFDDPGALRALVDALRRSDWRNALADQIRVEVERHFWIVAGVLLYLAMLAVCVFLALLYPRAYVWLGSAGRALRDVRIRFGRDGRELRIPIRSMAGLGFFDWHDRTARAWTIRYYRSIQFHQPAKEWLWVIDLPIHRRRDEGT
ncbi:HEAT repeat protein [Azospirillum lipoferum]|uniref:TOG domain-containing protein n=1 Tax=Azospirillum lipoferum TaxID=193 RepID=A0A5A9GFN6_AZOLI|nr:MULTISPECIES: HEAT repeat domain-containing protein [Azospirillum]KAA0593137.1 hypothetical protein FZ942_24675 [Azospirillum lipoferum]MCP1613540.1 HEAT repeat protein [Azospirillum lipoferum]MDW5532306.1 HEAT repeat domain-containing protein [Azospirillum sp. NL1]